MKFVILEEAAFRKFIQKSPYKSFTQTPEIAKYRESKGWTPYYFAATDNKNKILAAALIVAKPSFLGKSVYYCPGGPLMDFEDQALVDFFFKNLKKYIKSHNGYVLHIEPNYELVERSRDGNPIKNGFNRQPAIKHLQTLGFHRLPRADNPEYQFALDLGGRTPDELMSTFKSNTRGHIRKAEKMGVTVRELKREELPILKQITAATSARRHFKDKSLNYYEQMYDLFRSKGEVKFVVAEVELSSENAVSRHCAGPSSQNHNSHESESGTANFGEDSPDRCNFDDCRPTAVGAEQTESLLSVSKQRPAVSQSTLRNSILGGSVPLSAAMFILYGDEVIYLFSGSDEQYMKDYNAQYLIQWHMIKYAAEHKFKRYNFYGISGLPKNGDLNGIYEFKKGFTNANTGHVLELLGAYELPTSQPFYRLHRLLSKFKHR